MKPKLMPFVVVFAASLAHVLLFLGLTAFHFSDGVVILFLIVLPAVVFGVLLGASYGFVSIAYGFLFFFVYMVIGGLGFIDRTTAGAVRLGWEVEAIFCSCIVIISNVVSAVPAAIVRAKRR